MFKCVNIWETEELSSDGILMKVIKLLHPWNIFGGKICAKASSMTIKGMLRINTNRTKCLLYTCFCVIENKRKLS